MEVCLNNLTNPICSTSSFVQLFVTDISLLLKCDNTLNEVIFTDLSSHIEEVSQSIINIFVHLFQDEFSITSTLNYLLSTVLYKSEVATTDNGTNSINKTVLLPVLTNLVSYIITNLDIQPVLSNILTNHTLYNIINLFQLTNDKDSLHQLIKTILLSKETNPIMLNESNYIQLCNLLSIHEEHSLLLSLYEYFTHDMNKTNSSSSSSSSRVQTNPLYRKDIKKNTSGASSVSTTIITDKNKLPTANTTNSTTTTSTYPQPLPIHVRDQPSYSLSTATAYYPLFHSLIALKQHKLTIDILYNDMIIKRGKCICSYVYVYNYYSCK